MITMCIISNYFEKKSIQYITFYADDKAANITQV